MRQKIVKKGLGVLMAGALVFSVMPGVAMAEEVEAEPETEAEAEEELYGEEEIFDDASEEEFEEAELVQEETPKEAAEEYVPEATPVEGITGEETEVADEYEIATLAADEDITSTIQQEIDSGATYIEIPAGTWYCSGLKLNGVNGLTISADGATIIQDEGTNPLLYVQNGYTASNIVIDGGTWDGNGYALPVVRFYGNASNITIQNASVINTSDFGIRFNSTEGVLLSNVLVSNHAENGVRFDTVADATVTGSTIADNNVGLNFVNCTGENYVLETTCTGNTSSGVRSEGTASITLNDNELDYNGYGVNISDATELISMSRNNMFYNTTFGIRIVDSSARVAYSRNYPYYNDDTGLYMKGCTGLITIYKCKAKENGNCGMAVSDSANVKISGCTVSGNASYGINLDGNTNNELYKWAVNILDTSVSSNGNIGIRIVNTTERKNVENVTVSQNTGAGIYASECGSLILNGVTANKNSSFGININNGTEITGVSCVSTNNGDTGIRFSGCKQVKLTESEATGNANTGVLVSDNEILTMRTVVSDSNDGYGFNFNGITESGAISSVTATNNTNSGILFTDVTGVGLSSSTISTNGAHGIYMSNSTVKINSDTVEKNYWCGLSANGENTTARVNYGTFYGNGTRPDEYEDDDRLCAGIGIYEGATAIITEAVCNDNHGCGITAAGAEDGSLVSTISVFGCTANNNGDHGIGARPYGKINVKASTSGVTNTISNNAHSGYILNDHCASDYVRDCTITGNGKHGISVSENSEVALIQGNTITGNTEDGIHVSDNSSAVIKKCTSSENTLSGIGVYANSTVDISNSCVTNNNQSYGICIDTSTATSIASGKMQYNAGAGVIVRNGGTIESMTDDNVSYNETYGLYCGNGGFVSANGCSFKYNVNDGVRVTGSGSQAELLTCKMMYNEENGAVATSSGKITSMKKGHASGNGKYGIYCSKNGRVTMNGTSVNENGSDGIRSTGSGSKVKITNGTISENRQNGLVITDNGALNTMTGTSIIGNAKHGIAVYATGSTGDVTNVTTSGNGGYQIYVEKGANTGLVTEK